MRYPTSLLDLSIQELAEGSKAHTKISSCEP